VAVFAALDEASTMNKKPLSLAATALATLAVICWISPYWAIAGMAKAAQTGDAELLSDYIDLPRLKQSVKGQITTYMQKELHKPSTGGFEALGIALGAVMVDKAVDTFLTPEGLADLLRKQLPELKVSRSTVAARLIASEKAFWVNDDTFRIAIDEHSFMTWRRQGISWRLTSISIPLEKKVS
jgi:hypothetical protein